MSFQHALVHEILAAQRAAIGKLGSMPPPMTDQKRLGRRALAAHWALDLLRVFGGREALHWRQIGRRHRRRRPVCVRALVRPQSVAQKGREIALGAPERALISVRATNVTIESNFLRIRRTALLAAEGPLASVPVSTVLRQVIGLQKALAALVALVRPQTLVYEPVRGQCVAMAKLSAALLTFDAFALSSATFRHYILAVLLASMLVEGLARGKALAGTE